MPLSPEVLGEIEVIVRGGFDDGNRIAEALCQEMYQPGDLDREEVDEAVARSVARLGEDRKAWPAVTDCDRLDAAFAALTRRGIVALQNAGYTQSDGYDDVLHESRKPRTSAAPVGYCFYHGQDLARAVRGSGLYLAFGPLDPSKEESEGPVIGHIVAEELRRQNFEVSWNGGFDQRIFVPRINWKRRAA